jgi:hypothetical protein
MVNVVKEATKRHKGGKKKHQKRSKPRASKKRK